MSLSFRLVEGLPARGLCRRAAIFEPVVPLLNLCDAHGIVAENPLNLLNGFHLAITKLLAKFNATPLLKSFRFAGNNDAMHTAYTISLTC